MFKLVLLIPANCTLPAQDGGEFVTPQFCGVGVQAPGAPVCVNKVVDCLETTGVDKRICADVVVVVVVAGGWGFKPGRHCK
jgi:hypothetical protein